ncbi:hypothetical protein [Enterobacter hormaechei]|uniref:hypothetical protein n=1 Tax=Enterobacter hormaechei TaxID=158836 RepID=UPI0013FDCA61|nr:hypothetical protein [Enterobacter hormaechei]
MNYALELAQLTKTYAGGVKALRGIDLKTPSMLGLLLLFQASQTGGAAAYSSL